MIFLNRPPEKKDFNIQKMTLVNILKFANQVVPSFHTSLPVHSINLMNDEGSILNDLVGRCT